MVAVGAVALFVDGGGCGGDEVGGGGGARAGGADLDDFGGLGVVDWRRGWGGRDVDEVVVVDGGRGVDDGGRGGVDGLLDGGRRVDWLRGRRGGWGVDCLGVCFLDDFVAVIGF